MRLLKSRTPFYLDSFVLYLFYFEMIIDSRDGFECLCHYVTLSKSDVYSLPNHLGEFSFSFSIYFFILSLFTSLCRFSSPHVATFIVTIGTCVFLSILFISRDEIARHLHVSTTVLG